jgi:hypothetical protein
LQEPQLDRQGRKTAEQRTESGRFIDTGAIRLCYWPALNFAQIIDDRSLVCRQEFKVRPGDLWFKLEGIHAWETMLDPDRDSDKLEYVVRRESEERLVIDYRNLLNGEVLRIVAAPARGWNIIEYETQPEITDEKLRNAPRFWHRGKYEWSEDERGAWFLKRHEYQRSSSGNPKKLDFDFAFENESFTPEPVISPDTFTIKALRLAKGTQVEQTGKAPKTWYVVED